MAISKIKTNSIANDAITSDKLATGGIATVDMADGSVTSLKILDGAIATADIAASAITSAKIADANVTTDKLATTLTVTHALGSASTPSITFTGDTNTGIFSPAADTIAFAEGGAEAMRIDSSGNVGIGTSSPANLLTVQTTATGTTAGSNVIARLQSNATGRAATLQFSDNVTNSATISMVSGATAFGQNGTEAMRIDSSGNVGIGTSSPSAKLQVVGNVMAGNGTAATPAYHFVGSSAIGMFTPDAGFSVAFSTASTERMRIDSSGNLGINTSSPAHKLDVQSNVDGPIVRVINNRDTTGSFGIKVTLGASGGAGTTGSAHFHGNTNAVGNWYLFGNGTTSYSSDQRLKKNIESARDGYLEDLARLRVVKYNWNVSEEGAPKELGLIAQEVEQVFPGLVQDDANPVTEGDDTVYKQLKQSVLPFMLLKAIQELKAEFDEYKRTHP